MFEAWFLKQGRYFNWKIHFLHLLVQVLIYQTLELDVFTPRESTLSDFVAADESIIGNVYPESECHNT